MAVRADADPVKVARLDQLSAQVAQLDAELEAARAQKLAAKAALAAASEKVRDVLARRDPPRDEMMQLIGELSDNVQNVQGIGR